MIPDEKLKPMEKNLAVYFEKNFRWRRKGIGEVLLQKQVKYLQM